MLLTVEIEKPDNGKISNIAEVAICFDDDGLEHFIRRLESLRNRIDHEHLMTPSYGGEDLTENKQGGEEYMLINHLRLVHLSL